MAKIHTIAQSNLTEFAILHFAIIQVIIHVVVHELEMLLTIVLHTSPNHALEGVQTLIPQLLARDDMSIGGLTSHPKQTFHFLVQYQKTTKISFHAHLKIFVGQSSSSSQGHQCLHQHPNDNCDQSFKVFQTMHVCIPPLANMREPSSLGHGHKTNEQI